MGTARRDEDDLVIPQRKMDRTTKKRSVLRKQLVGLIDRHEETLINWDLVCYMRTHCSIIRGDIPINPKVRISMESFNKSVSSPKDDAAIEPNKGVNLKLPGAGWANVVEARIVTNRALLMT